MLLSLLIRLRDAANPGSDRVSDRELLTRFAKTGEASAFELLFWRHGATVWGVCRRVLGDSADAEDAFQATFLVLARRATTIKRPEALAAWLHRVAWRTALNALARRRRITARERSLANLEQRPGRDDPARQAADAELRGLLDRELLRLPEKLRLPVVLCDLQAQTNEAAAATLHCPLGTLNSRLARGRKKLRERLLRRGVALTGLIVTAIPRQVSASALDALRRTPSVAVQTLADCTIRTLALTVVRKVAIALVCGAMLVGGLAVGAFRASDQAKEDPLTSDPPKNSPLTVAAYERLPSFSSASDGPLPAEAVARIGSPRFRHTGDVTGLTYSPDGKWLASISTSPADSTARVLDAATGKEQLRVKVTLDGKLFPVNSLFMCRAIEFSTDSRDLLVVDANSLRIFEVASGKERLNRPFAADAGGANNGDVPTGAAVSPDGRTFVLAWGNGQFDIRDVASGAIRHTGKYPSRFNNHVSLLFSGDSRRIVLGFPNSGGGRTLRLIDSTSGRMITEVRAEGWLISDFHFVPRKQQLVMRLQDEKEPRKKAAIGFYDLVAGKLLRTASIDWGTYVIAPSPDGKLIAVSAAKEFSQLLDAETGKEVGRFASTPSVMTWAFSPDGKWLAGARLHSGAISVWDVATRRYHPNAAEPITFFNATFSPSGRGILLRQPLCPFALVDWRTGAVIERLAHIEPDGRCNRTLSPDGKVQAVSVWSGGPIRVCDARTGAELRSLAVSSLASSMTFSADGRRLASLHADKGIRVWEVATGQELARFTAPNTPGAVFLELSHDGRVLAVSCYQNGATGSIILAWDVNTKQELTRIEAPSRFFTPIALSPDGRFVAGGGGDDPRRAGVTDDRVMIWDIMTGHAVHVLAGHSASADLSGAACAFSPDGRLLATGDGRGLLRIWEVASGQELHELKGHQSRVYSESFSPDGRLLVAASEDAPCYVWNVAGTAASGHPMSLPDLEKLWTDLESTDGKRAFAAVRNLVAAPEPAITFIGKRLQPDAPVGRATVDRLLRDLDADDFSTRETATKKLLTLADRIQPQLVAAAGTASVEAKRRLDEILETVSKPTPRRLRESRALLVLEWIGTSEVIRILDRLANGDSSNHLAQTAAETRSRLRRRVEQ
jgi:RNA polymerase sigma factor (sigma-70 family)